MFGTGLDLPPALTYQFCMRLVATWILALMFAVATVPPHGPVSATGIGDDGVAAETAGLDCCDAASGDTIDAAGHCALDCKGLFDATGAVAPVRGDRFLPGRGADVPRQLARRRDRPPI